MSQLRGLVDPLRSLAFCYGSTDRSDNTHLVPTINAVLSYRERFAKPSVSHQHFKRASSQRNEFMEVFSPRWEKESGSMLYVIVKKGPSYAIGSPLCVETGLYNEFKHLRRLSFNSASRDVKNMGRRDENNQPFTYVSNFEFGDLVVVLNVGMVQTQTRFQQVSDQHLTALDYYVIDRDIESGVAVMVRGPNGFSLFKSFGDLSLPPCTITEPLLKKMLNAPCEVPDDFKCMLSAPPKQPFSLPNVFLVYTELILPHRKVHRLALNFNRTSVASKQLLTDVSRLTTEDVNNYRPYSPVPSVISCKMLDPLDICLNSLNDWVVLQALKALRSAKLQSGSANFNDFRFIEMTVVGSQQMETGSLYVELSTTAALSLASFTIGRIVKLETLCDEPVIGKIVKAIPKDGGAKVFTVLINKMCGINEDVEDEFDDNIEKKAHLEWLSLVENLTEHGRRIPMTQLDFKNSFDCLMSSEQRFVRTELSARLLKGLVEASLAMKTNKTSPHLVPSIPLMQLYGKDSLSTETLSTEQILPFVRFLKRDPNHEELAFYQNVLNRKSLVHLHESPVGSGKTTVLAAAVKARLCVDRRSRVAVTAMTNAAITALLKVSDFPLFFSASDDYNQVELRALVVQSNNWKHANGIPHHCFDWKIVMSTVFAHMLKKFDIFKPVSDETNIKMHSIFLHVHNNSNMCLPKILGDYKYKHFNRLKCGSLSKREIVKLFFAEYKPNLIYATMDSLVNFAASLPVDLMPDFVAVDESTMVQPSDLALFSSKLASMSLDPMEFLLVGDHKQLDPYNTLHSLSPLTVTPNVLLINTGCFLTRFTTIHRCHPDATKLVSTVFYGGYLQSGRTLNQQYLQHRLSGVPFRKPFTKAFSFQPNSFSCSKIAQSRCNNDEASAIVEYAKKLVEIDKLLPDQITVLTPYMAQSELLQKLLPEEIQCTTTRKFQGLENDVILFSCVHSGGNQPFGDVLVPEGFKVRSIESGECSYKLIDDNALILVSLTRSRHFTTVFGNEKFLRTIPTWNQILTLILD